MASDQRTVLLCGNSAYLLETFSGIALDDGWIPRVAKSAEGLPDRLAAAPADRTIVVVDLSIKEVAPEKVIQVIASAPHPVPLVGVCPPGMPKEQIDELKAAGFSWLFDAGTPEHEIRFALKSLTSPPPPEHRKEPRAPAAFTVRFTGEGQDTRQGIVADLNEGGMFIETDQRCMLGEQVHVSFELPDQPGVFEAQAEVVFSSPKADARSSLLPGNGLKFRDLPPETLEAVRTYVSQMLKRMPGPADKSLIGIRKQP